MNVFSIAIDGPAGAGKSTIAKKLAAKLGCIYVDTGAMYRATGLYCIKKGIDYTAEEQVNACLKDIQIDIEYDGEVQHIYLNKEDVTSEIRSQEVAKAASKVATYSQVRSTLVSMQRALQGKQSIVMDGRDIGTVVLPKATLKIFLTASTVERAKRRFQEYAEKGLDVSMETLIKETEERDAQDMGRAVSPLKQAEDAVVIDSTHLGIDETIQMIINLLTERVS